MNIVLLWILIDIFIGNVFEQDFNNVVDTDQYYFGLCKFGNEGNYRELNYDLMSNHSLKVANESVSVCDENSNKVCNEGSSASSKDHDYKSTEIEAGSNGTAITLLKFL